MLNDAANALPKLKPTERHTIKPGPAVDATASISSIKIMCYSLDEKHNVPKPCP